MNYYHPVARHLLLTRNEDALALFGNANMAKKKNLRPQVPNAGSEEIPPGATVQAADRPIHRGGGAPGSGAGPRHAADDVGTPDETYTAVDSNDPRADGTLGEYPEGDDENPQGDPDGPYGGSSGGAVGGTPAGGRASGGRIGRGIAPGGDRGVDSTIGSTPDED
jgi:hypothetical protein